MCEKVHVRACMQCWREFAKCRFTHFPSFFSVHVDTYGIVILRRTLIINIWREGEREGGRERGREGGREGGR